MRSNLATPNNKDQAKVLTKAFIRMTDLLQLSRQEVSVIIGLSEASLSRLFSARTQLDPHSNEGQLAILLLRLFRSLDTLFGGNVEQCRIWLRSNNKHLENKPIELIKSIEGLVHCIHYLDAMRGKN